MSTTMTAMQRCPRCGNENRGTNFACTFCGKRLRIESIERLYFFRRIEDDWVAPYSFFRKIYYLFVNCPRAFWDINHARKKSPGNIIYFVITLLYGFMGFALFSHFRIVFQGPYQLDPLLQPIIPPLFGLLAFFIFGLIYHYLLFRILIWLFSKGANYAVDYSERLESRFGKEKEEVEKYSESEMSPFSIYKGGVLQQQQAHKNKMMLCAFAPFMLIYAIEIPIILFALPNVEMTPDGFTTLFVTYKVVWAVLYALEALVIMIWVPSLIAIAIRELSNSSTFRLLIPSYAIGIIVGIFYYFFRPPFIIL